MTRETGNVDDFAELRDGLLGLVGTIDRLEEDVGIDLAVLRVDVETLLTKLERNVRGRRGHESAAMTFDRLLSLDKGFGAVASRWATVKRSAGLSAASELVERADLSAKWRDKWAASFDVAWRARIRAEERGDRVGRIRAGADNLPVEVVLDLRYGMDLPFARIGEFFDLSASAVQARVAAFESRVAESVALTAVQEQLPPGWKLHQRAIDGDFETHGSDGRTIVFDVIPAWPERDAGAGRPREPGSLFRRTPTGTRVWTVVEIVDARVIYVPDVRVRAYGGSTVGRQTTIDQIVRLAPEIGFTTLARVIEDVERGDTANEA